MEHQRDDRAVGRLREGWVEFLNPYDWSHVGTLTTDRVELSRDAFARKFLNTYTRVLARLAQGRLGWFAVVEGDRHEDRRTHLHFAVSGTASLTIKQMQAAWSLGQTKILRFDDAKGGLAYLTKHLPDCTDGVIISSFLQQRPERD